MTTPNHVRSRTRRTALGAAGAMALAGFLAGCGEGSGGDDDADTVAGAAAEATEAVDDAMEAAASGDEEAAMDAATSAAEEGMDAVETMKEDLEGAQAAQGGGSARLTVGDDSWTFDRVLCAIGEEETGQEGAEFVLSSIQDGLQFYVSVDSYGHSVSLDDIEDFENPSVSLSSRSEDFIQLDGRNVSGEMVMVSGEDFMTELEASFEGACP